MDSAHTISQKIIWSTILRRKLFSLQFIFDQVFFSSLQFNVCTVTAMTLIPDCTTTRFYMIKENRVLLI